jgi:anti-sigma factor RsiW
MTTPITEDELQAYADGVLDGEAQGRVAAWLADHSEDAARIAAYGAQSAALHDAYDAILREPVPPTLRAAARQSRQPRAMAPWRRIAASVAFLLIGGAAGWMLNENWPAAANITQNAIGAHAMFVAEKRHAVEVQASEETHLVRWLSKRLGQPVKAPNLIAQGYRLVGGRLLPDHGRPAAQFMYENTAGVRLTVYVRRNVGGRETEFRFTADKGVSAFYWGDGRLAYVLAGTIGRPELLEVAKSVHRDLSGGAR